MERIEVVEKEDLDLPNHLTGLKRKTLKIVFRNQADMLAVRKVITGIVYKNNENFKPFDQQQTSKQAYLPANFKGRAN